MAKAINLTDNLFIVENTTMAHTGANPSVQKIQTLSWLVFNKTLAISVEKILRIDTKEVTGSNHYDVIVYMTDKSEIVVHRGTFKSTQDYISATLKAYNGE